MWGEAGVDEELLAAVRVEECVEAVEEVAEGFEGGDGGLRGLRLDD